MEDKHALDMADNLANGTGFSVASFLRALGMEESERETIMPVYEETLAELQESYGERMEFEGNEWHVVPEKPEKVMEESEPELTPEPKKPEEESNEICVVIHKEDVNQTDPITMNIQGHKTIIPLGEQTVISKDVAACMNDCGIKYSIIK